MDYDDYRNRCTELAEAFEAGDLSTAEAGWRELLGEEQLSEIDRTLMLHNLALTLGAMQRPEEAEAAFDEAITRERALMRGAVRVGKANWLRGQGRAEEAAVILDELAAEPWVTWGERRDYSESAAHLRDAGADQAAEPDPGPRQAGEPDPEPQKSGWWRGRR